MSVRIRIEAKVVVEVVLGSHVTLAKGEEVLPQWLIHMKHMLPPVQGSGRWAGNNEVTEAYIVSSLVEEVK